MAASPQFTQAVLEALQRRGRTVVRVQGHSMYPSLCSGMRLEVQPVAYDELRVGDLVVFHDGRGIVCHRLLRKAQRLCYLKGDTNLWSDPPVVWSQVLGRVTRLVDTDLRIYALDTPRRRWKAVLLARFSYPYAVCFHLIQAFGRCRWWTRGIEMAE